MQNQYICFSRQANLLKKGDSVMDRFKDIYKSFVMIYSEIIWIYYVIVLFTSVEWDQPAFFDLTYLMISGITGYCINVVLLKSSNHVFLFLGNMLIIVFFVIQNWKSVVPQGAWGFGLAVSIGIIFILLRSARLTRHLPTRQEVLRRFEGNIIYYIIFASAFTVKEWASLTFHLFFIFAIASSLIGMVLTLQNHEETESSQNIKIIKAGQSGWFTGIMIVFLMCMPLFSLIFLLPSVNKGLYSLGIGSWRMLKWTGLQIGLFFKWLFSLFPEPEMGEMPAAPPGQKMITSEALEETTHAFPVIWMIAGTAVILTVIAVWYISRLRKIRLTNKFGRPRHIVVIREPGWSIKSRFKNFLHFLRLKWCMQFFRFYKHPIYWYYQQVLKWGKKNDILKEKTETSKEYIEKVINHIPEKESSFSFKGRNYKAPELLIRLNKDYQATYYGLLPEISGEGEYKLLIDYLKKAGGSFINEK